MMRLAVTGAGGFVGRNLRQAVAERGWDFIAVPRDIENAVLEELLASVDAVVHLAGVNRPQSEAEFAAGNSDYTAKLIAALDATGATPKLVYSSSIQAEQDNPYGTSKRAAENALADWAVRRGAALALLRLPNIFGKWSRPDYNSVVATFCHNIGRDLPIRVDNAEAPLNLIYVDDLISGIFAWLEKPAAPERYVSLGPIYETTVGLLAEQIRAFHAGRAALSVDNVGTGLTRALYSTYISFLPPSRFSYNVPIHSDPRGSFVEMLKTPAAGQFSFFTSKPGVTRGGHYHHSKVEKFLVVKGRARFGFRNLADDEFYSLETTADQAEVVETIPGWSHDITNCGDDELVVMLWANEVFDRSRPDTFAHAV